MKKTGRTKKIRAKSPNQIPDIHIEILTLKIKTRTIKTKIINKTEIIKEDKIGRIMAGKDRMEDIKNKEDQDRMMTTEIADLEMKEIITEFIYTTYLIIIYNIQQN